MPLSKPDEKRQTKRPIVLSQGEPSGIGPEVAVKAWSLLNGAVRGRAIRLVGNAELFLNAAVFSKIDTRGIDAAIADIGVTVRAEPGRPSRDSAASVTASIEHSVAACRSGAAAAMVTAPI